MADRVLTPIPVPRGVVRDRGFATQMIDYSGLCYGRCTPCDIDGFLDCEGRGFVLLDYKFGARCDDAKLSVGQELAYKRECTDHTKPCLVVAPIHQTTDDTDVDGASARVGRYRFNRATPWADPEQWHPGQAGLTVVELINRFRKAVGCAIVSPTVAA